MDILYMDTASHTRQASQTEINSHQTRKAFPVTYIKLSLHFTFNHFHPTTNRTNTTAQVCVEQTPEKVNNDLLKQFIAQNCGKKLYKKKKKKNLNYEGARTMTYHEKTNTISSTKTFRCIVKPQYLRKDICYKRSQIL